MVMQIPNDQRLSTTTLSRNLLREGDRLLDAYRAGAKSEGEARKAYAVALARFQEAAAANFQTRLDNSGFFRDPAPQPERGE